MSDQLGTKRTGAPIEEKDREADLRNIGAGWPWGAEPAPPELVDSFEGAIAAWDRHVLDCRSCLHRGQWFCPEGARLNRRVAEVRARFGADSAPPRTVSVVLALGQSVTWQLTAHLP
jgi:hypothetical protein